MLLAHLVRIDCVGTTAVVAELKDIKYLISELDKTLAPSKSGVPSCASGSKTSDLPYSLEGSPVRDIYNGLRNLENEFTTLLGILYRQRQALRSLQRTIKDLQVRVKSY